MHAAGINTGNHESPSMDVHEWQLPNCRVARSFQGETKVLTALLCLSLRAVTPQLSYGPDRRLEMSSGNFETDVYSFQCAQRGSSA